jgi:apolipoprotein D and lipocalin family protein
MFSKQFILAVAFAVGISSSPLLTRQEQTAPVIAKTTYDGSCYYPQADVDDFELDQYLGRWYQVAGTVAPFTAGCKCIFAQYGQNVGIP